MTEARRITLNALASYGKSIVTLPLNLLSARWVLSGLGVDDFGLYGLVGGVVFFITFVNSVSAQAVARFFAYAIGTEKMLAIEPIRSAMEQQRWFNAAMAVHFVLPMVVLAVGYPVGCYAITHWLVLPADRVGDAVWVLRMSFVQAFLSTLLAPYIAFYVSHQLIANLTIFTLLSSVSNAVFAYFFARIGGSKLLVYSLGMTVLAILLTVVQSAYAYRRFPAARLNFGMMSDIRRIKELLSFAWWRLLSSCGWMLRTQGSGFVANYYCGVAANAAISVASQLSAQTAAFSAHLNNAFMPAVVTSTGASQQGHAAELSLRSSKFSSLLVAFFGIPMILLCDEIVTLWLGDPPPGAVSLCAWMIGAFMVDKLTVGQECLLTGYGEMAAWQTCEAVANGVALLVCWYFLLRGEGVVSVGVGLVATTVLIGCGRVYFSRRIAHLEFHFIFKRVLLPVLMVDAIAFGTGILIGFVNLPGIVRIVGVVFICSLVFVVAAWMVAFSSEERSCCRENVRSIFSRCRMRG